MDIDRISKLPSAPISVNFFYDDDTGLYASANSNYKGYTRVVSPPTPSDLPLLNCAGLKSDYTPSSKPAYGSSVR